MSSCLTYETVMPSADWDEMKIKFENDREHPTIEIKHGGMEHPVTITLDELDTLKAEADKYRKLLSQCTSQ